MMHCSKRIRCDWPSALTSSEMRTEEAPGAAHHGHLALLREGRQPTGQLARRPCSSSRAACRDRPAARRTTTPCAPIDRASSMTLAACSRALDGMQPTLRQTPPEDRPALDQRHREAEVRGAEGGRVAARTRAEHEQLRCWRGGGLRGAAGAAAGAAAAGGSRRGRLRPPQSTAHLDARERACRWRPRSPFSTRTWATRPATGGGHVHRRLVGLERDDGRHRARLNRRA